MTQNGIVLVVSVSIIKNNNEVFIIKENKPSDINKWNFPSGRIEKGEDILVAACREVKEETGYEVKLSKTTGIYNFISSTNHQVILFHFIGEVIGGSLNLEESEIIDSKWITLPELMKLENQELRNAGVIKQITEALLSQKVYPISFFKEQISI
ncbi:NUDIX domain-containing protein [Psychrobacillus sp. INOP01]|uniref:NUDIX hydrolase n=1 Tax=Psychrobacillus sp. INOP01 TaxID=2829187 RepID=UPI001BA7E9BC|nr:NUDIX domain-containing protein [Psychrobacillus sp. INOP01]QUG41891.1 NUDIX domain-containing protein [Psychrobacillus sp. INOP01]